MIWFSSLRPEQRNLAVSLSAGEESAAATRIDVPSEDVADSGSGRGFIGIAMAEVADWTA